MAFNKPVGDNARKGAVRKRTSASFSGWHPIFLSWRTPQPDAGQDGTSFVSGGIKKLRREQDGWVKGEVLGGRSR